MSLTLFTAAGCARCVIAKKFMAEKGLAYDEHDAVGEGKEMFGQFYRAHRSAIFRGKEGIEFPVLAHNGEVRQGLASVIAWLRAGAKLDGFIGRNELSKGWVGGLNVSGGDPAAVAELVAVLGFLKKNGMKLEIETDGRNATVLERLLDQVLGDRVVMDIKGPRELYSQMIGAAIETEEVGRTMTLVARFPEYRFETTVTPVRRAEAAAEWISYLTPEEIAETARWLKVSTGSHRQPYFLKIFDPRFSADDGFRAAETLSPSALVRHRTAARKHQVLTEVQKISV
jgi:pyruvate formate lyase activating enzyme